MDALYPTCTIGCETAGWKLRELTINPMLWISNAPRVSRRPLLAHYEVWAELVLGHDEDRELELPRLHLEFNDAFDFTSVSPPEADAVVPGPCGLYNRIYFDYWNMISPVGEGELAPCAGLPADGRLSRDPLLSAFGLRSQRVIRDEPDYKRAIKDLAEELGWLPSVRDSIEYNPRCKGGLAFWRSRYAESADVLKLCYPCRWSARSQRKGRGRGHVVTIGGLSLHECDPRRSIERQIDRVTIGKDECISLWYSFPYAGKTGRRASTPDHGLYSFVLAMAIEKPLVAEFEVGRRKLPCSVNIFPRVAAGFEVSSGACNPPIQTVPRLDREPTLWTRAGMGETRPYRTRRSDQEWIEVPTKEGGELSKLSSLRLHYEFLDRSHSSVPSLFAFVFGALLAASVNVISPDLVTRAYVAAAGESDAAGNGAALPLGVHLAAVLTCLILAVAMHDQIFRDRSILPWLYQPIRSAYQRLRACL